LDLVLKLPDRLEYCGQPAGPAESLYPLRRRHRGQGTDVGEEGLEIVRRPAYFWSVLSGQCLTGERSFEIRRLRGLMVVSGRRE